MPRDGAGLYSKPGGTTAISGTTIQSAPYNTLADDLANALTDSVNKDGTKAFAANQSMGTFRLTSLGDATSASDAPRYEQTIKANAAQAASVAGTVDAITVAMSPVWLSQPTGARLRFTAAGANTSTAPTLKIDALAVKTIKKHNSVALAPGDIIGSGHICDCVYNGTDFILLNPGGIGPGSVFLSDNGATEGPTLSIDRLSASPAASDIIGATAFLGRSSTAVSRTYARIRAVIKTATNAAEDGLLALRTILAGTEDDRFFVGGGLYSKNATGGDKGIDTINASKIYTSGGLVGTYIRKPAAESIDATAAPSLQPDDDLIFPIAANTDYTFDLEVFYITPADADFRFEFDSTAATDPSVINIYVSFVAPGSTSLDVDTHSVLNATVNITSTASSFGYIYCRGMFQNGADAGNFRFRWSNNAAGASGNTIVRKGSNIRWVVL
jgi:hypothetical protein